MKLWENGDSAGLHEKVEEFTAGEDIHLDQKLVEWDVVGSIAHATMLNKIGILTDSELIDLRKALVRIIELNEKGKFVLELKDEDVHTKIENNLTETLGSVGKKIHTGRSRNDQVQVDLRLYTKEKLFRIEARLFGLCRELVKFAEKNKWVPMPGYTHFQKAMPSSVGLWAMSYAESLMDDQRILKAAFSINDQNPLGSAAGYGVPLNLDRDLTTRLLGFANLQNNVLYVQNSRGKIESIVISALAQIMLDLSRLSNDLIIYSTEEFGFFTIGDKFRTGSSIMPNKRNPDILELVRGKMSTVTAGVNGGVLFAQSTQEAHQVQSFPEGVAIHIPPKSKLVAQIHLLNPSDSPLNLSPKITLTPLAKKDVTTVLAAVSFENHALGLPPQKQSRFTLDCDLQPLYTQLYQSGDVSAPAPDFKIYYALAHYHKLGTGLTLEGVKADGTATTIFTTTAGIGDALGATIDPAFDMTGYTRLRFSCDYFNNTDATVPWGVGSNEMCVYLAFSDSKFNWAGGVPQDDAPGTPTDVNGVMSFTHPCQVFANDAAR